MLVDSCDLKELKALRLLRLWWRATLVCNFWSWGNPWRPGWLQHLCYCYKIQINDHTSHYFWPKSFGNCAKNSCHCSFLKKRTYQGNNFTMTKHDKTHTTPWSTKAIGNSLLTYQTAVFGASCTVLGPTSSLCRELFCKLRSLRCSLHGGKVKLVSWVTVG